MRILVDTPMKLPGRSIWAKLVVSLAAAHAGAPPPTAYHLSNVVVHVLISLLVLGIRRVAGLSLLAATLVASQRPRRGADEGSERLTSAHRDRRGHQRPPHGASERGEGLTPRAARSGRVGARSRAYVRSGGWRQRPECIRSGTRFEIVAREALRRGPEVPQPVRQPSHQRPECARGWPRPTDRRPRRTSSPPRVPTAETARARRC